MKALIALLLLSGGASAANGTVCQQITSNIEICTVEDNKGIAHVYYEHNLEQGKRRVNVFVREDIQGILN